MATLSKTNGDTGVGKTKWDRVEEMEEFRLLILAKKEFVIPATIFFVVYYFLLPVLVGYAPGLMNTQSMGAAQCGLSLCSVAVLYGLGRRNRLCRRSQKVRQVRRPHPGDPQARGIRRQTRRKERTVADAFRFDVDLICRFYWRHPCNHSMGIGRSGSRPATLPLIVRSLPGRMAWPSPATI